MYGDFMFPIRTALRGRCRKARRAVHFERIRTHPTLMLVRAAPARPCPEYFDAGNEWRGADLWTFASMAPTFNETIQAARTIRDATSIHPAIDIRLPGVEDL
jgi:hypothetical protein